MQIAGVTQPADTLSCYEAGAAPIACAIFLPQTRIMDIVLKSLVSCFCELKLFILLKCEINSGVLVVCNAKIASKIFLRRRNTLIILREMVAEEGLEPPTRGL